LFNVRSNYLHYLLLLGLITKVNTTNPIENAPIPVTIVNIIKEVKISFEGGV
jgi:hypothetical protein